MSEEQPAEAGWRNRIVRHGEEAPEQLLANPHNWRIHPRVQQDAIEGALNEIGWVQNVIVNERTGHVIDGHARVAIAISRGEPLVPVAYVDLDENEERIVLLSFDPLGNMALVDQQMFDELVAETAVRDEALLALLQGLTVDKVPDWDAPAAADAADPGAPVAPRLDFISVTCPGCATDFRITRTGQVLDA